MSTSSTMATQYIWFKLERPQVTPSEELSLKDVRNVAGLKNAIKNKVPVTLRDYDAFNLILKAKRSTEGDERAVELKDPRELLSLIQGRFGADFEILVSVPTAGLPFQLLSPSTSVPMMSQEIINHPNFEPLFGRHIDISFLDKLSVFEKNTISNIFRKLNKTPPNPAWSDEVAEVQLWVQNVYESLAKIWDLTVNLEKRRGGEQGGHYADHYLTYPTWSDVCDTNSTTIDFKKCYAFEDKVGLRFSGHQRYSAVQKRAIVQCHRYSRFFFDDPANRVHTYISVIADGARYMLWYAYWDKQKDMIAKLTDVYDWNKDTLEILGRVFKTFHNSNIGKIRAAASPPDFEPSFPSKDISNLDFSNLTSASVIRPLLNQYIINDALYSTILDWAKRHTQSGLPIVTTSIGDIEACEILGAGFNAVVFEARTTNNVRVALKYSLNDDLLRREAQMLKELEGLEGIPKLLHEEFRDMIPYIVTSMVGQKITEVDVPTACNIIIDILDVLESLHEHGFIHNDIHPGNIVKVCGKFRLIDFGLAVQRSDKRDNPPKDWPAGHIIFASHNRGKYLGAGDDLEALCYTVAFMYDKSKEYWCTATQDPHKAIRQKGEKLFGLFDGLPRVFRDFFDCVYDLNVTATPDYEYWQQQFRQTARDLYPPKKHRSETLASPGHELESERRIRPRTKLQHAC